MSLINSRGLVFPSYSRESAERSTSISSCDEPTTPPAGDSAPAIDSRHLSVSLLYPDTAPRSAWRPQIDAWMRRNHPADLKRISTMANMFSRAMPYKLPPSRSEAPSPPMEHEQLMKQASLLVSVSPSRRDSTPTSSVASPKSQAPQITRGPPSPQYTPLFVDSAGAAENEVSPAVTSPIPQPVRPLMAASVESKTPIFVNSDASLPAHPLPPIVGPVQPVADKFARAATVPRTLLSPPASPPMPSDVQKTCISCSCSQSPCWRPSWSPTAGQLCNSCGLRYKKTGARCINAACGKIPSKGEWNHMIRAATQDAFGNTNYTCLQCHGPVALRS
ncbi:hypothetical protein B9G98_03395 [Wickerhamiella sorbophila]|uniref:GATA-type domain-containing protein n=1 Tax=Wickerhamiella sorbophila TaxID=45607 RepID=A0A2T0FLC0_9ASCO|nr:hypothetical protein B9G98_03395 [Wickerhamiella sorbophila]PRT55775.1 hypothetical protein B9G98_03395 [Wickerhamiella sorbophila]